MAARNMYPVKKNNWSFRGSIMPVPGDGIVQKSLTPVVGRDDKANRKLEPLKELPKDLQKRSRMSVCQFPERQKKNPQKKRHIFQRVEDNRQQNALKRYERSCNEYEESKNVVMKKTDKIDEEILMENINLYRMRQENILILEKSKSEEDKCPGDNMWEISLREHWTIEASIGDLSSEPQPYDLLSRRTIERIGNPLKENMSLEYFKDPGSRENTRKSRWGPFEHYMERLEKGIRTVLPHKPNFYGFQVVGEKLRPDTAETHHKTQKQGRLKFGSKGEDIPEEYHQPAAKVSTDSLLFSGKSGEIMKHFVTIRNVGTTALFFTLKKQPVNLIVKDVKPTDGFKVPTEERFTAMEKSGKLSPKESKEICFNFMSKFSGSFVETWVLWTHPTLSHPPHRIFLKGVATCQDPNTRLRENVKKELEYREMVHGVEEVTNEIMESADERTCRVRKKKPQYLYSSQSYTFMKKIFELQPAVYYSTSVEQHFLHLIQLLNPILVEEAEAEKAKKMAENPPLPPPPPPPAKGAKATKEAAPPPPPPPEVVEPTVEIEWAGSGLDVLRCVECVKDEKKREELLKEYSKAIQSAAIPPHPSSTFHRAMYGLVYGLVYPLYEAIESGLAEVAAVAAEAAEAKRKKAEEEGIDVDMIEEEEKEEVVYDEDGEVIPPPPPPMLYECESVGVRVKEVLWSCFLGVEDEIEKLEDGVVCVIDGEIEKEKKKEEADEESRDWNVFVLEKERLFVLLGKDR